MSHQVRPDSAATGTTGDKLRSRIPPKLRNMFPAHWSRTFTGPTVRGTRRTLVNAALVLVAVSTAFLGALVFPRTNNRVPDEVDVAAQAARAAEELTFTPSVPVGLPDGWTVTRAVVRRSTHGLRAWHVGYRSPDGHFVGVDQVVGLDARWVTVQVAFGQESGPRTVAGRTWTLRVRDIRGTVGLVHTGPRVTTVVTGHTTPEELDVAIAETEKLAAALPLPDETP